MLLINELYPFFFLENQNRFLIQLLYSLTVPCLHLSYYILLVNYLYEKFNFIY